MQNLGDDVEQTMQQNDKKMCAVNAVRALWKHSVVYVLCTCYDFCFALCNIALIRTELTVLRNHHALHTHREESKQYSSMRRFVYRHIFGSR